MREAASPGRKKSPVRAAEPDGAVSAARAGACRKPGALADRGQPVRCGSQSRIRVRSRNLARRLFRRYSISLPPIGETALKIGLCAVRAASATPEVL